MISIFGKDKTPIHSDFPSGDSFTDLNNSKKGWQLLLAGSIAGRNYLVVTGCFEQSGQD